MTFNQIDNILKSLKKKPGQTIGILLILFVVIAAGWFAFSYISEKGRQAAKGEKPASEAQSKPQIHIEQHTKNGPASVEIVEGDKHVQKGLDEASRKQIDRVESQTEQNKKLLEEILRIQRDKARTSSEEEVRKKAERVFITVKNSAKMRPDIALERGSIMFHFTPTQLRKNKYYLIDLIGWVDRDRISLFMDNRQLVYQVITAGGTKERISVDASHWETNVKYLITSQWDTEEDQIRLIIHGPKDYQRDITKKVPNLHFDQLGPIFLTGTDFEGNYPVKMPHTFGRF